MPDPQPLDFRATLADEEYETFWVPVDVAADGEAAIATVHRFAEYHGIAAELAECALDVTVDPVWMRDVNPEAEFGWEHCAPTDEGALAHWKVTA